MEYKTIKVKDNHASEVFNHIIRKIISRGLKIQPSPVKIEGDEETYHRLLSKKLWNLWSLYETEEHEYFSHEKGKQGYRQQELYLYKTSQFFSIPIKRTRRKIMDVRDYISWKTSSDEKTDYEDRVAETITFLKNKNTIKLLKFSSSNGGLEKAVG